MQHRMQHTELMYLAAPVACIGTHASGPRRMRRGPFASFSMGTRPPGIPLFSLSMATRSGGTSSMSDQISSSAISEEQATDSDSGSGSGSSEDSLSAGGLEFLQR